MARFLSKRPSGASASNASRTSAMSRSRNFSPFGKALISKLPRPVAVVSNPRLRICFSTRPSILPEGRSRLRNLIRPATSSRVRSTRRKVWGATSTQISSSRAPNIKTRSTPRASRPSRMRLAMAFRAASLNGPDSAIREMVSYLATRLILGFSLSSGRVVICATAESTSERAACMSLPALNSTRIVATPSTANEVTLSTLFRYRTSGSMAVTMLASTSSAPAPGQAMLIATMSMPKSGKNWVFIRDSETTPITSIITINRLEALRCRTNRRTKSAGDI